MILSLIAVMATIPFTNPVHHAQADRILENGVYQYLDKEVFGCHFYICTTITDLQKGDTVEINNKTYTVYATRVVSKDSMWVLRRKSVFTCVGDKRFVAFLE